MASVQKGTFGVVWSLSTTVTATGLSTGLAADTKVQSIDFGVESKTKEIVGADGETQCVVFYDQSETMTIEVIPSVSSITSAKVLATNLIPDIGTTVTIIDSDDSEIAASTWICMASSKRKSTEGEVRITMTLRKYTDSLPTIALV